MKRVRGVPCSGGASKVEKMIKCIDQTIAEQLLERVFLARCREDRLLDGLWNGFPLGRLKLAMEFAKDAEVTLQVAERDVGAAIKEFIGTELQKHFFPELDAGDLTARVVYLNGRLVQIVRSGYRENDAYCGGTSGVRELVEVYQQLLWLWCTLDWNLQESYAKEWNEALYDVEQGCARGVVQGGRFLVHFFADPKRSFFSEYPLSCSLISKQCQNTYRDYGYGFMHDARNIVGMSPGDVGSAGMLRDFSSDVVENLFSLMGNDLRVDEHNIWMRGQVGDMLSYYPVKELEKRTSSDRYNEILIRGSSVPSAVFVFRDCFARSKKRVLSLCCAMNLPLVMYDREQDETKCVQVEQLCCDVRIV